MLFFSFGFQLYAQARDEGACASARQAPEVGHDLSHPEGLSVGVEVKAARPTKHTPNSAHT